MRKFKTALAVAALATPTLASASLYPSYIRAHYPASIQPLMLRENALDDHCRGAGDSPDSMRACNQREIVLRQLQERGWCWGGADIEANMKFIKCKPGDRDYDAHAFDKPAFSDADIAEAQADARYSQADVKLNYSYRRLLNSYRGEGRVALRDAQRVWLANRNHQCGIEAQNGCSLNLTIQRTSELNEQFARAGGL